MSNNDLKMAQPVADEEMVKNAVGEDFDELTEPPQLEAPWDHKLWKAVRSGIREIYDPEIPVNIYELGLIYLVDFKDKEDEDGEKTGESDVFVQMTLTSPGCPVAQEMPGWVQAAILPVEGVADVEVEIIWDPTWTPAMMAETAKMQLNMFT